MTAQNASRNEDASTRPVARLPTKRRRSSYTPQTLNSCQCTRQPPLLMLPDDMLLLMITYLQVEDILSLRMTSKRLCAVTKHRWVWTDALKRHIINKGLPLPAAAHFDLKRTSTEDLEARIVHATSFDASWQNASRHKRVVSMQVEAEFADVPWPLSENLSCAISQIVFLPGMNGEYIATVIGYTEIICWDVPLDGSGAFVVARWRSAGGPVTTVTIVANEDTTSSGHLAVAISVMGHPTTIEVLEFDRFHGRLQPIGKPLFGNNERMLAPLFSMRGDYILAGDTTTLWNWRYGAAARLPPIRYNEIVQGILVPNPVVAARLVGRDHLIVVQEFTVHLIQLTEESVPGTSSAAAAAQSMLCFGTNSICTTTALDEQVSEAAIHPRYDPTPGARARPWDAASFPPHGTTVVLRTVGPSGVLRPMHFLPLDLDAPSSGKTGPPVVACRSLALAPSCGTLVFGPSGRGLCMETRNRARGTQKNSTGPARCVVGLDVGRYDALADPALDADVRRREGELYVRRAGVVEVAQRKYQLTALALEDTVGRVAVGDRYGKVEVLEFA